MEDVEAQTVVDGLSRLPGKVFFRIIVSDLAESTVSLVELQPHRLHILWGW